MFSRRHSWSGCGEQDERRDIDAAMYQFKRSGQRTGGDDDVEVRKKFQLMRDAIGTPWRP